MNITDKEIFRARVTVPMTHSMRRDLISRAAKLHEAGKLKCKGKKKVNTLIRHYLSKCLEKSKN